MTDVEKVINGLECHLGNDKNHYDYDCDNCKYGPMNNECDAKLVADALALLKAQEATINELYNLCDGLCKDIREKYESDDVCGLCQYDGAYVGDSGDWMNECPGFETNECFCMKNSIRKMC
jgi:hypothetical protein